jgi:hypothetical protein
MSERNIGYKLQFPDQDSLVFAGVQCEVQLVGSDGGLMLPGVSLRLCFDYCNYCPVRFGDYYIIELTRPLSRAGEDGCY